MIFVERAGKSVSNGHDIRRLKGCSRDAFIDVPAFQTSVHLFRGRPALAGQANMFRVCPRFIRIFGAFATANIGRIYESNPGFEGAFLKSVFHDGLN